MNTIFYPLFLLIFSVQTLTDSKSEIIIPFESVGDMKIDVTTFEQCEERYPDAEYSKYWESSPFLSTGNYVRKVVVENEGKVFFFRKKKRLGKYFLSSIRLTNDFKGSTDNGIRIGSNYSEIVESFGKGVKIMKSSSKSEITYFKKYANRQNGVGMIIFSCFNNLADSTTFEIDQIYIK